MKPAMHRERLIFYATPDHACSYLPGQRSVTAFLDPTYPKDTQLYTALSQCGFRRSGQHIYRPRCQECEACIPVRVNALKFLPRRSQRRAWHTNQDLTVRLLQPVYHEQHYDLYRRYLHHRHQGGGMDDPTPRQYMDFLVSPWSETGFYEFRLLSKILAVAVLDRLDDGLSAVYTFFEPEFSKRSLGVFSILWSIHEVRRLDLEWLYLGYWIETSAKMRYKCEYQPQQHLRKGIWAAASES